MVIQLKPLLMKNLLLVILLAANLIYADDNKTKSTLTNVTVYQNGTQVTRTSNIYLPQGTKTFTFNKLWPFIQLNSQSKNALTCKSS